MNPVILMRKSLAEEHEFEVARKYFTVIENRSDVDLHVNYGKLYSPNETQLVIPRYSALPYYKELEYDVDNLGGELINSYQQHLYVADLKNWYEDLKDLTPRTWWRPEEVPSDQPGSFVLKGATNSRKGKWRSHMLARDRHDIGRVLNNLLDDVMISEQGIYVRQFEEFETYGEGINGLPITNEWRYFILDGKILASGFYWSEHFEQHEGGLSTVAGVKTYFGWATGGHRDAFVRHEVIPRVGDKIRFWVVDVAKHVDGRWRVVELNDGQMSGISCVDPDELYKRMAEVLDELRQSLVV